MSFFVVINFRALDTGLTENPGPTAEPTYKRMRHDSAVRPVESSWALIENPAGKLARRHFWLRDCFLE